MNEFNYKFQMYRYLQQNLANIYEEAKKVPKEIGIPKGEIGKFGLTGAVSGCHGMPHPEVIKAMDEANKKIIPNKILDDELREVVKSVYGDDYDGVAVTTCEAALWVSFDCLVTPPMLGRGDNYRARYIAPYERHIHHQGGYGRPFPGRFKDIIADRGDTAGELGMMGKRQNNTDTVLVPLVGAKYDCHGIKYHPTPLLVEVDPEASIKKIAKYAERHSNMLSGFASLAYDTPGYGYGEKDNEGTCLLQKFIGSLAKEYDVPYIMDNAWGMPFVGTDIRKTGADVVCYSVDKSIGGPTAGLIIGRDEVMIPIRRALGVHGDRWGTGTSHGKAAYVTFDSGKEGLIGAITALKVIRDKGDRIKRNVDKLFEIVKEEFEGINPVLKEDFIITKSYNSSAVEINYQKSWKDGKMGIPIFSIEDMYAGTNIIQTGMSLMGIMPSIAYDANIFLSPGLGTVDEEGILIEERYHWAIKSLVRLIEIISNYAGLI